MKHLKFLTACLALLLSLSINAQNSESEGTLEEMANARAEIYTAEMISTLNITDASKINTIEMLNNNFELTAIKSADKKSSPEDRKQLLKVLNDNRNRRLQGVLTGPQYEAYLIWSKKN